MIFFGQHWGGRIEVGPVRTTKGRLLILCRVMDTGQEYCITVSRWLHERKSGAIVPEVAR